MPSLTPGQIIDALASGEPTRLIGAIETEQVDFKQAPYRLNDNHQKWELAKDVAAFANKRGGVIVVGVRAERRVNEIVETAVDIRPIPKALVDLQQHRGVIDSWIYPRPSGIDLRWYPPDAVADHGLLVIEVPAQQQTSMPFILREMTDPEAGFRGSIGIPRRDGERIVWDSPADIHRHMNRSVTGADLAVGAGMHGVAELTERARRRVDEMEQMQGWDNRPTYFLQALPPTGTELEGFYGEIRHNITQHQILRQDGFAPWRYAEVGVFSGGWTAHRDDVVTLVEPDGLITNGLLVSEGTYLGWYYNDNRTPEMPLVLHPIAAAETTLEFFRFFYSQILPRADGREWRFRVSCHHCRSNNVVLPPGHPTQRFPQYLLQAAQATGDEWDASFNQTGSPGRDGYEALQRLYALFGHGSGAIPLTEDNAISETMLQGLR